MIPSQRTSLPTSDVFSACAGFGRAPGRFNGNAGKMRPSFFAQLNDAGAGAVSLALGYGSGSATFTRATVAWTKLSTGLWAQVASGTARSSYLGADTTAGAYGGYFAEGAGTQLVTPSASIRDMTDASWVAVTMTKAKTATGIDGVVNSASTITATGATSTVLQTLTAAASSRTYSAFVRRKTGTGTCLLKSGAATLDITALINSVTYTRVSLTDSTLNTSFGIQINTSGDALEVDFNQFEAGGFASSPMAAAGAARNADALTYVFAGNASASAGTVYAEIMQPSALGVTSGFIGFSDTAGRALYNGGVSNNNIFTFDGTTPKSAPAVLSSVAKCVSSWGGKGLSITSAGATPVTGAFDGAMGAGSNIEIGQITGPASNMFGTIRNVIIWTTQLPNNVSQVLAA